jgi:hypothetical protein
VDGGARAGPKAGGLSWRSPRLLIALALLATGALGFFLLTDREQRAPPDGPRTQAPDPRLAYAGPFRNVRPDVRYVPDSRCADCHADIAASFAEHPMGRSLFPVARAPKPPAGPRQNNPFTAFGDQFRVEYTADGARHHRARLGADGRPAAEQVLDVHYVIGSGTRGYSYLTDLDGYLLQTPISWYSQKDPKKKGPNKEATGWDLSPGFIPTFLTGRPVFPECLFCHANRAEPIKDAVNRYGRPVFEGHAIGCQRCHGPGELHADAPAVSAGADGIDPTIVNPRHLAPDLRQAVCEQCHLQGAARVLTRGRGLYDFRPGLPFSSFWSVFVAAPGAGKGPQAVGQVEQMYLSRCFQGGDGPGRLGCTSCHDPHERVPPERRAVYYRGRCLQCHTGALDEAKESAGRRRGCSAPVAERRAKAYSCIACHMPRYGAADIPHTAATDHRIPRGGKAAPPAGVRPASDDPFPVVSFYRGRKGVDEAEEERGRALALVRLSLSGDGEAAGAVGAALPALDRAWQRDPDDLPAGEARAYALAVRGRPTEALAAFRAVLARAPERELSLVGAATAAEVLGQSETAIGFWRRAVAANPKAPGYRRSLVLLLAKKGAWAAARPECEAWLRRDPLSAEARTVQVSCLLAAGEKTAARAAFARLEALAPPKLGELRIRFAKKLR